LTSSALAAQLQARAVHQQMQRLAVGCTGVPRPRHVQRRRAPAQGGVVRHAQAETKEADDGAEQALGLPVGQAEHRAQRERRQDGDRRIPRLPTAGRAWLSRPRRDRLVGEPHREAAALAQAGVVGGPVRHPAALLRDVVAAVLVQFEWQDGHPEIGRATPYVSLHLSTTANPCTTLPCLLNGFLPRFLKSLLKSLLSIWLPD